MEDRRIYEDRPAARDGATRSGFWKVLGVVIALPMLLLAGSETAAAQGYVQPSGLGGFVQGLFGSTPAVAAPPPYQTVPPLPALSGNPQSLVPQRSRPQSLPPSDKKSSSTGSKAKTGNASASLGGGLRTMCVRLCDGYYWPITFNARRSRLDHDSKVCNAACTSEARVFTMPDDGEAKDMVDREGRAYTKLANAFRYRKSTVDQCTCRPNPWDGEARARHQTLAGKAGGDRAEVDASVHAEPQQQANANEAKTKTWTVADAEAAGLSGGSVDAVAAHGRIAGPAVGEVAAPAGSTVKAGTQASDGDGKSAETKGSKSASADKIGAGAQKSRERSKTEARPAQRFQAQASLGPGAPYAFMPGQGLVAVNPSRRQQMIVQPNGMLYRTY